MSLTSETRIRQSPRTASRVVEDQAVVIVIDAQQLHTLNEVGTFIWDTLGSATRPVQELVDALLEEFDVEPDRAQADVVEFVRELTELGAIELEPS